MKKFKIISLIIFTLFFSFIFSQNNCVETININENESIIIPNENLLLVPIHSNFDTPISSFQFNLIYSNEFLTFQLNQIDSINNSIYFSYNNIPIAYANTTNGGFLSSNVSQIDDEYSILTVAYATSQIENYEGVLIYIPFLQIGIR